jgi:GNAT superfamily N-acetyltransferase
MSGRIDTGLDGATLRFGGPDDVELILDLIRELAAYEKLSHEVSANPDLLRLSLFGERQVAEVVIVEVADQAAGFALFFHSFSTFLGRPGIYLEDLFIKPAYRGRSLGLAVMTFLARLARERGCGRLEWSVLDWNASAIGFYRRLGAQCMDEWTGYRLTGSELDTLASRFPLSPDS